MYLCIYFCLINFVKFSFFFPFDFVATGFCLVNKDIHYHHTAEAALLQQKQYICHSSNICVTRRGYYSSRSTWHSTAIPASDTIRCCQESAVGSRPRYTAKRQVRKISTVSRPIHTERIYVRRATRFARVDVRRRASTRVDGRRRTSTRSV